jgi:hypothetical protein
VKGKQPPTTKTGVSAHACQIPCVVTIQDAAEICSSAVCKTEIGNEDEAYALRSSGLNAIPSPKHPWKSRSGDPESDMVISETPGTDTEELNLLSPNSQHIGRLG